MEIGDFDWPFFAKFFIWRFVMYCKNKLSKKLLLQKVYLTSVFIYLSMLSSRFTSLSFLSQQKKYMLKVNLKNTGTTCSKVNNKDTKTTYLTSFWYRFCYLWTDYTPCYRVSNVDFEQGIDCWVEFK